jgi:Fe2+ or Zn2+ uptake regulation protein
MFHLIDLTQKLSDEGFRLTAARRAIVQVLEQEEGYFSPEEILNLGRQIYPPLGRATVYRPLDLLTELGVIRPILLGDNCQRYIPIERGHHHLLCSQCGHTFELVGEEVEQFAALLAHLFPFRIQSHLLELYGLCENCQQDHHEGEKYSF